MPREPPVVNMEQIMIVNSLSVLRVACSTFLVLCSLIFAGCSGTESSHPIEKPAIFTAPLSPIAAPQESILALEQDLEISLPASTAVINSSETPGSDKLIRAKLLVNRPAFEQWLTNYGVSLVDFEEDKRYQMGPNTDWWDPKRPTS